MGHDHISFEEEKRIFDYYRRYNEEKGGEADRLNRDNAHMIEFRTSMYCLSKYLPKGCSVLDCCAGGGAYAFPLARLGYKVTAGDLLEFHVDILNAHDDKALLSEVYQGDALDMTRFYDGCFDSVLCMGALYHLQAEEDRVRCVSECLRVLKPGGVFVFSYINRYAVFINHFKMNPDGIGEHGKVLDDGRNGVFYGMKFGEADHIAGQAGLMKLADIGTDGPIYPLLDEINSLSGERFDEYMKIHIAICEEPSILGQSMHGLWIGRKKV